ncbi:GNAT family N-acetyltransferase [Clostridium sp. B9]|uniref:GNAT family N-acetyltransferase n=1 Tax=Clostridium sp. B9 TaxID=3423224 RepID=UPI003D2F1E28
MKIIPLSKKYYKKASKLVDSVFFDEDYTPSKELKASLSKKYLKKFQKHHDSDVLSLKYYIAIDNLKSIIGIIGLYTIKNDSKDNIWLGWYCVSPDYRGKKIGKTLLEFAIEEAKRQGKKYLYLYTSTESKEAVAQKIYDINNFDIIYIEDMDGYSLLYRKKFLQP